MRTRRQVGALGVATICLLGLLGAASAGETSSSSDCKSLLSQLTGAAVRDPEALERLLKQAQDANCSSLVKLLCRRLMDLPDAPQTRELRCDAAFRLARIQLLQKQYNAAYSLLYEVISQCPEHAQARILYQSTRNSRAQEQVSLVQKGDELAQKGKFANAVEQYERALELTPEDPTGTPHVPKLLILSKLAESRDEVDRAFAEERVIWKRSVKFCDTCGSNEIPGFIKCAACNGSGELRRLEVRRGRSDVKVYWCPKCSGHGARACGQCGGLGYSSKSMTPQEKEALQELVRSAASPEFFKLPLPEAISALEKVLLEVTEGSSLNFLRAIDPDYALSKELRKEIGRVPPSDKAAKRANDAWRAAQDPKSRFNFLIHYGCEYADYIQHFDMLRSSTPPDHDAYVSAGLWDGETLAPEVISAFPDETKAGWLAVDATLLRVKPGEPETHKGYLEVKSEAKGSIVFFAWLPSAQDPLKRIEDISWDKVGIEEILSDYPFELWERLQRAPREHRVRLVGRFLRDRFADPRNWFEVWDFRIGLSQRQDEIAEALREPIDIEIPPMALDQVAEILGNWCDIELSLDGVDRSARISCVAEGSPKGILVDTIVKQVPEADWYYRDGRAVVCPQGDSPMRSDMQSVLETLRSESSGKAVVGSTAVATTATRAQALPNNVDALKRASQEALKSMDYDRAVDCLKAWQRLTDDSRTQQLLDRARSKYGVFHELTWRTPVSHLVGASNLYEVAYEKPSGEVVEATVILEREGGTLTVQEGYGASIKIRPDLLKPKRQVSAENWQKDKEAILAKRERESQSAPESERVTTLFFNALYAKTFGFPDRGYQYLNEAFELDGFETFLEAFFPEKSRELLQAWYEARGRKPPPRLTSPVARDDPEPASGADIAESLAGEPPPTTPIPVLSTQGLSDDELERQVREYLKQANACTKQTFHPQNAALWRNRAIAYYEQAEQAVRALIERHPGETSPRHTGLLSNIVRVRTDLVKAKGFFDE